MDALHDERFQDRTPAEVVATLAEENRYVGSERTLYRLLERRGESRERRNQLVHANHAKPELLATAPNQVGCRSSAEHAMLTLSIGRTIDAGCSATA